MNASLPAENVFLDLSDRTKLKLTGADRVRFLNGQVSNDVRLAKPDEAVYTGVMTIKGKLGADAFIHAEADALWLDAAPEQQESLAARLEKYIIADDVQLEDATDDLGLFHLLNFCDAPGLDASAPGLPEGLKVLGSGIRAVRARRFGREGLDIFFDAAQDEAVRHAVHHATYTLLNDDALESLRILMGVPQWGAELDESVLPAEAGIEDRAVSFTKGCYIGQEVVSRVRSVGHVNRLLRGFKATDASPLYAGMKLHVPGDAGGKEVGRLTSVAPSAGHGGAAFVALGYIRREHAAAGVELDAALPPEDADEIPPPCRVEVCDLPFA